MISHCGCQDDIRADGRRKRHELRVRQRDDDAAVRVRDPLRRPCCHDPAENPERALLEEVVRRLLKKATGSSGTGVRGRTNPQTSMLAVIDPESRIPANHPLRTIKRFADAALAELSPQFDELYAAAGTGRASIPPERLLKASLPMSLFSVRSERAFCEALDFDLRFRWFLDMDLIEPSFDPLHLHQESGTAAGRAHQSPVLRCGGPAGRSVTSAERRALHGGWHANRSRGQPEELPSQR